MAYTWEKESSEKYGEKSTLELVKQQQEYEVKNKYNDCNHCGSGNEGSVIERDDGTSFILHFGLWSGDRCTYCGKES